MRIRQIGLGIWGFYRLADYALRSGMVTEEAQRRLKILGFWQRHGLAATTEAFGVSRRTLQSWKAQLKQGGGKPEALNSASRAPHRRRRRQWPPDVVAEIRRLRHTYPNLSKEKIHPFLAAFCAARNLPCPSPRTIGRLIADDPHKMRLVPPRLDSRGRPKPLGPRKDRKPAGFRPRGPGHCVALDSVHRVRDGIRRYLITCTDIQSRFGFALAVSHLSSRAARVTMELALLVFPVPIRIALTDNGSEFMKEFQRLMEKRHIQHWFTYPRKPNMNAHVERFNRTVQDEFVDYHEDVLYTDLREFNDKLMDWILWYNGKRPHWALNLKPPIHVIAQQHNQKCNMYWPDTHP